MNHQKNRIDMGRGKAAQDAMRQRYQEAPRTSKATLRASAKLVKNTLLEGRIGRFTFTCDEPPARGGDDAGPSPLEFFLIGAAF